MKNWSLPKMLLAGVAAGLVLFALVANFVFSNNGSDVEPTANPSPTLTREGDTGRIQVVTSTRVWAEISELLASEWVEVVSLVPENQNPESYQPSAEDFEVLSEAELVIANGGGYDDFLGEMVEEADFEGVYLSLVEANPDHVEGADPHIWYDFELTLAASEQIVQTVLELRPEAFDEVTTGFDFFISEMANLRVRLEALRERALGFGFVASEPVANLMFARAGFDDLTPNLMKAAITDRTEPPASSVTQAAELLSNRVADILVVNIDATDSLTAELVAAAETGNRPIIRVAQTGYLDLGDGSGVQQLNYLDWMAWIIDQVQEAIY
jgi:ABC-type metal ion transport system, periplasmic component/surface adhesin